MAVILHGSCSMPHTHSHSHAHSHTPAKTKYQRLPSNKHRVQSEDRSDYDGLTNNNTAVLQLQQQQPSFIINGSTFPVRSDSVCSYRSPNHSRTNSFSNGVRPPLRSNSFSRSLSQSDGRPTVSVRLDEDPDENNSRFVTFFQLNIPP